MPKVNKVYASFYNGVSEQVPELILDTNCKDMINCLPNIVYGLKKRPPLKFKSNLTYRANGKLFHSYDRGEDNEEYLMIATGDYDAPIEVYNKAGTKLSVLLEAGNEVIIKDYLNGSKLKGMTVQDRTWLFNKDKAVGIDTSTTTPLDIYYKKNAYYWLSRGSGDTDNAYNYAVYINNLTFQSSSSNTLIAAKALTELINNASTSGLPDYIRAAVLGSVVKIYIAEIHAPGFRIHTGFTDSTLVTAKTSANHFVRIRDPLTNNVYGKDATLYEASEKIIEQGYHLYCDIDGVTAFHNLQLAAPTKIGVSYYNNSSQALSNTSPDVVWMNLLHEDISTLDFTFSSWDSWGSQASNGWKGEVNKITDLPKDMTFDNTYIKIIGDENNNFTAYYVKWNGQSWEECLDPEANRGRLSNMPLAMERTSAGVFTIKVLDWSVPLVGNVDNNPDPSFVGYTITDLFFYKNRLGIASTDSIILSKTASYENFYIKTAIDVLDIDPIDVAIATNKSSKIYYVKPFNNSLYIFTKESQFELTSEGYLSPKSVSINSATNYPMAIGVEPQVINNSLYFISTTGGKQQLREYIKNEKLTVEGVDLNIATPNYLQQEITSLIVNGVLGYVLCCTSSGLIYVYNFKETGKERVQSAWSKWQLLEGIDTNTYEYAILDASLIALNKVSSTYRYHSLELDNIATTDKFDTSNSVNYPYKAKVQLPDFYPHIKEIGTPRDKILLKKVIIEGSGNFDATVHRLDYNKTYTKTHTDIMMQDLDFHIASKVSNVNIYIEDNTSNDFSISSITMEGLYSPTSKQIR